VRAGTCDRSCSARSEKPDRNQGVDAGVFEHIGVIGEGAKRVQRSVAAPRDHDGTHRAEHLGPILRERGDPIPCSKPFAWKTCT